MRKYFTNNCLLIPSILTWPAGLYGRKSTLWREKNKREIYLKKISDQKRAPFESFPVSGEDGRFCHPPTTPSPNYRTQCLETHLLSCWTAIQNWQKAPPLERIGEAKGFWLMCQILTAQLSCFSNKIPLYHPRSSLAIIPQLAPQTCRSPL